MKKILLILSIVILSSWIVGYFILHLSPVVHILLALSLIFYIRSLLYITNSPSQKYYEANK
ncbi:MAG: hypothetical protein IPP43_07840 [Chitinophagaceae bacterium]|nr:hypothetical protein [Chitinophagaceae bacterium]MBL0131039.1 hypothetical protein [Chitinophagaceae bacterium]